MDIVAETWLDTLPPGATPPVRVVVTPRDGALTLTVRGEADMCTSGQLLAEMMSALPTRSPSVVVDFAGLSFCDLAGIDAIRHFVRAASAGGARVDLCGMSPLMSWMYNTFYPSEVGDDAAGRGR